MISINWNIQLIDDRYHPLYNKYIVTQIEMDFLVIYWNLPNCRIMIISNKTGVIMLYIYISIIFIIFCVILVVKNPKSLTTRFIILMLTGWISSFMGLFLYISSRNEYFYINEKFFNINLKFLQQLQRLDVDPALSVRLINIGVLIFIYSLSCFSLNFTFSGTKRKMYFALLAIIPGLELLFYDPVLYKTIYRALFSLHTSSSDFESFYTILEGIHWFTSGVNKTYIAVSLLNMVFYVVLYLMSKNSIKFIWNYALFVSLSILPIAVSHTIMFAWAPKILINVSVAADYYNFLPIHELTIPKQYSNFLQFLILASFTVIVAVILRYNVIEFFHKQKEVYITKRINIANMGVRIFSHAVKNQLISIMAEAEMLEQIHAGDNASMNHVSRILDISQTTLDRLNELHRRFNNINLHFESFALNAMINKAIDSISNVPQNIKIRKVYSSSIPTCLVDAKHMNEVIVNLINNAIEAIQEKENGEILIHLYVERKWGILSIADNGCGIPSENIDSIFNPFFSTKSSSKNWGVGLSYCHKIVSAHGGKILVESVENKGSVFKIALPIFSFRSDENEQN